MKKKSFKIGKMLLVILCMSFVFSLTGCGPKPQIVGTWVVNGGSEADGTLVFEESGDFTMTDKSGVYSGKYELTQKEITLKISSVDASTEVVLKSGDSITCGISIDDDGKLVLDNSGEIITYTKK